MIRRPQPDEQAFDPGLVTLDDQVAELLDEKEEERLRRLEHDPFSFPSEEAFRAFRRRRGLR